MPEEELDSHGAGEWLPARFREPEEGILATQEERAFVVGRFSPHEQVSFLVAALLGRLAIDGAIDSKIEDSHEKK
jgi:hypothetical protein